MIRYWCAILCESSRAGTDYSLQKNVYTVFRAEPLSVGFAELSDFALSQHGNGDSSSALDNSSNNSKGGDGARESGNNQAGDTSSDGEWLSQLNLSGIRTHGIYQTRRAARSQTLGHRRS